MAEKAEQEQHHVITIQKVEEMEEKIKEIPKLLNPTAGKESCCIFKVPGSLVEINGTGYHPLILSIGPYHHGKSHLNMIEEHKWKFLGELLDRTPPPPHGLKLDGYLKIIAPLETRIRDSYSEFIHFTSFDLIKMMVLDGLFIIELISRVGRVAPVDPDDPIFSMAWVFPFLMRDLLRLENQIPFFVLQTLFEKTRVTRTCVVDDDQTLAKLILNFFNYVAERPDVVLERFRDLEGKHLLDFFRKSFIIPPEQKPRKKKNKGKCFSVRRKGKDDIPLLQLIPSAKKLSEVGIKFKSKNCDTFLEIRFSKGVLEIPQIVIDDFTTWFLLNAVAFEQCYKHCSKHMTAYSSFMGCLIDNPTDAGFLGDQKIVENYFGTDKELARFFSNLGKDVSFDIIGNNYLSTVFEDVNEYHRNGWHVQWAGFKYTYFNTPWSFISALAATILLLLNVILAFFAVYPYAGGKLPG